MTLDEFKTQYLTDHPRIAEPLYARGLKGEELQAAIDAMVLAAYEQLTAPPPVGGQPPGADALPPDITAEGI
jgi:hypothetical protein